MKELTCGFICSTNEDFLLNEKIRGLVKDQIRSLINDEGYSRFITGMNLGGDLFCAECIIECKDQHPNLFLKSVFPYENQAEHWTEDQREQYYDIASKCDDELLLQYHYNSDCERIHQMYIAITSDTVVAVMSSESVQSLIDGLSNIKINIIHIDPASLKINRYSIEG